MRNLIFTILITLLLSFTVDAQKIYKLHEVKQIPTINNQNMDVIAASIQKLFQDILINPQKYSTYEAAYETVYEYYDPGSEKDLYFLNDIKGRQYTDSDSSELKLNQFRSYPREMIESSLLFNLTFEETGELIVPEKINVISYRTEDVERDGRTFIEQTGLLSFELIVNDSIRALLDDVKLETLAKIDINSMTGALKPVAIKCPFKYKHQAYELEEIKGQAIVKSGKIDIALNRSFNGIQEKYDIIRILREKTEIRDYKKGKFQFTIVKEHDSRIVGFNIVADNLVWNRISRASTGGISRQLENVVGFSGEGKKL